MILTYLIDMDRWKKQLAAGMVDFLTLWLVAWLAFVIRLGEGTPLTEIQWLFVATAPIVAIPGFIWSGLYRSVIRFSGEQALLAIAKGTSIAGILWWLVAVLTGQFGLIAGMPRSAPFLFMVMAFASVAAARFTARWLIWRSQRMRFGGRQALIYGAGIRGQQLAVLLRHGVEHFPAGFIDHAAELQGKDIDGLRVYAPKDIPRLIERFDISDVILSEDAFKHQSRREIMRMLEPHPVHVRSAASLMGSLSNKFKGLTLTNLDPIDLLDREPVEDHTGELADLYKGSVVLVTGAAGSIGSEICRRLLREQPSKLVLLDHSEVGLYRIQLELREFLEASGQTDVILKPVLADIRDADLIRHIFEAEKPKFVFHAAAYKHVPLIEDNPIEGTRVNVFGTLNCALASVKTKVEHFVLISTDKAVNPTSVMGMTKRVAELLLLQDDLNAIPETGHTKASVVRFGNVLDSSGSVIPLFRRQIASGGPVTVSDPEVTRYFMTIPQAASLVLKTPTVSQDRDVLVLDMGEPVKILDIAKRMIRFSGLRIKDTKNPSGDIAISFTGLRPGEKLHEELTYNGNAEKTSQTGILRLREEGNYDASGLDFQLRNLAKHCNEHDPDEVARILRLMTSKATEANLLTNTK